MKRLEKLKLNNFERISDEDQKSFKGGGHWVIVNGEPCYELDEVIVTAERNPDDPFNLWGPGSVYGTFFGNTSNSSYNPYPGYGYSGYDNYGYSGGGGGGLGSSGFTIPLGYRGETINQIFGTGAFSADLAISYNGVEEIDGNYNDNPTIIKMLQSTDATVLHDYYPWCAAFMNYIFGLSGRTTTGSCNAHVWQDEWGHTTNAPQAGDIYFAGSGDSLHMGIVVSVNNGYVTVVSGNSNSGGSEGKVSEYTTSINDFTYRTDSH